MEESSRESQPRCPCGFWGSTKTLGLCSVCYREARRNQSQGNTNSADAGKTAVGTCHSQPQNSNQGKRMDSKHFPSRSTADNLPSSLSSPPGERTTLSAAPATPVDATPQTTSAGGDVAQAEAAMTLSSCEGSDLCSSTSSNDLSIDSKRDASRYTSDSCGNLVSVTSSIAASESEENIAINSSLGNQNSLAGGTIKFDFASNSSTPSAPDTVKTLSTCAESINVISSIVASSSKNSAAKNMGERRVDLSTQCDINSQASTSNYPVTNANRSMEQAPAETNISSVRRGVKRSRDEMEGSYEVSVSSPQKNKRRCFVCFCKLELAQRTIGQCRCDRVFCALHRLPELHECEFNHKEDGRREAREKMVKPTRHLGPSYHREDHS